MKKHTEKTPIDELFARKLGNMSLPPSPNSFERLQARMGKQTPKKQIGFWNTSRMQSYIMAAACLLLMYLFGWLYWQSEGTAKPDGEKVTMNTRVSLPLRKSAQEHPKQKTDRLSTDVEILGHSSSNDREMNDQVVIVRKSMQEIGRNKELKSQLGADGVATKTMQSAANDPVLARITQEKIVPNESITQTLTPRAIEQLAEIKPIQVSEHVLIVTISEPEVLAAARQAEKASIEEKSVIARSSKTDKETKAGNLWQQVKRVKQGEIFARQDNENNDDRGLIGRAYNGLKHSFDKDKSAKQ